jgi:hypothetical protein
VIAGIALLAVGLGVVGYPLQRHYLASRFANSGPESEGIPGMHLNSAYRWARDVKDARIGLAGTTAGFASYGFYGVDLSNQVEYLGATGPDGAFNAIPSCSSFPRISSFPLLLLILRPFDFDGFRCPSFALRSRSAPASTPPACSSPSFPSPHL